MIFQASMPWSLLAENIGNDDSQGLSHALLWGVKVCFFIVQ
jgi:hypothetical protein